MRGGCGHTKATQECCSGQVQSPDLRSTRDVAHRLCSISVSFFHLVLTLANEVVLGRIPFILTRDSIQDPAGLRIDRRKGDTPVMTPVVHFFRTGRDPVALQERIWPALEEARMPRSTPGPDSR